MSGVFPTDEAPTNPSGMAWFKFTSDLATCTPRFLGVETFPRGKKSRATVAIAFEERLWFLKVASSRSTPFNYLLCLAKQIISWYFKDKKGEEEEAGRVGGIVRANECIMKNRHLLAFSWFVKSVNSFLWFYFIIFTISAIIAIAPFPAHSAFMCVSGARLWARSCLSYAVTGK